LSDLSVKHIVTYKAIQFYTTKYSVHDVILDTKCNNDKIRKYNKILTENSRKRKNRKMLKEIAAKQWSRKEWISTTFQITVMIFIRGVILHNAVDYNDSAGLC